MPHTGLSIADTCSFDEARSTMGSGLRSIETTPGYQAGDGEDYINTFQSVSTHTNTAGDCISNEQEASIGYLWLAIPMRVGSGSPSPRYFVPNRTGLAYFTT